MNIEQLLDYISDREWISYKDTIRDCHGYCPILAAYHKKFPNDIVFRNSDWMGAGLALEMLDNDIRNVVNASDYGYSQSDLHQEIMKKLNAKSA